MPTSKQGTNKGNFRPAATIPVFSKVPVMMQRLMANKAAKKPVTSISTPEDCPAGSDLQLN